MKNTRLFMLMSVVLLTLVLVGMALAADSSQNPIPFEKQPGITGIAPSNGHIEEIIGSTVNYIDPSSFSPAGSTINLCFNVTETSIDTEWLDGFDVTLPSDWVVNNVTDVPGNGCGKGHTVGVNPGNVVYWYTKNMPSNCGDWESGTYNFCANVTYPAGCVASWNLDWNIYGDNWGDPPHLVSGSAFAFCEAPGIYLTPESQTASDCSGTPKGYSVHMSNLTGYATTVNLTYSIIAGVGICTGPASVELNNGGNTIITVNLTAGGTPGDTVECQVYAVDALNPAYFDTAMVVDNILSTGLDPAGWRLETNAIAVGAQWQSCAVGTNPAASGAVGYQIAGFGVSTGATQANLQMYDPSTSTWTQLTAAPDSYFGQVAGWIDGKLYVAGGFDSAFTGSSDLEVYDPNTNTWDNTTPANLPVARGGGSGGVGPCHTGFGDCLFVVGGAIDGSLANSSRMTYEYNPVSNTWTQMDDRPFGDTPDGISLGGGVGCNGYIFDGGDYRGFDNFFALDPQAPAGSQWTQLANIPATAGKMTPAMVCKPDENAVYLIGGDSLGNWGDKYNAKVFRYNIGTDTWDGPLPQTINQGLLGSCGLYMDYKLWTFGGTNVSGAITPAPHESLAYFSCAIINPAINFYLPVIERH